MDRSIFSLYLFLNCFCFKRLGCISVLLGHYQRHLTLHQDNKRLLLKLLFLQMKMPPIEVSCCVQLSYRQRSCWKGCSIHKSTFWHQQWNSQLWCWAVWSEITSHSNISAVFRMPLRLNNIIFLWTGTFIELLLL